MSSENGVPAESVKSECYGNRRFKEMVIRIVVDKDDSELCDQECHFNEVGGWCPLFQGLCKDSRRTTQCLKEFGE